MFPATEDQVAGSGRDRSSAGQPKKKERRARYDASSNFNSSFQCPGERRLVCKFQVPADGDAAGEACDDNPQRLEQPGEINCRGFAFDVWVEGKNNFPDVRADPHKKL